MLEIKRL
jgi:hypothetical protein